MNTDTQLYEIFRDHPEWIGDLMNDPFPEPGEFCSLKVKKSERRLDGLMVPTDKSKPLRVIEFQFFRSKDIYYRAVEQRIAVHRLYPRRQVEAIIFFATRSLDARPAPWTSVVDAVYLDKEMLVLAQRQPHHPLPKLLAPVFERDEAKLEATAASVYNQLGSLRGVPSLQRATLQDIYTSFLLGRFKNKTPQEITAMITTLDIRKTRTGRELIAEGKAEGKAQTLIGILGRRFGGLPAAIKSQIEHLDFIQLEKLDERVLDLADTQELSKWLGKLKAR
jgi:predicted transposase YdaD